MDEKFTVESLMKRMTPEVYVNELQPRTDVPTSEYDPQRERLSNPRVAEELVVTLEKIIEAGKRLDLIKKHVYYGEKVKFIDKDDKNWTEETKQNFFRASGALNDNRMAHIAHGIIGKATEATELCEALKKHIYNGAKFDEVNIIEEIGDGQWYDAMLLKVLKVSFVKTWSINIAKLYKRFGQRFSEEKALNRDLSGERKILEG